MLSILVGHSYFLRFDEKQRERAKPYPPLATLQVAALLRAAGHEVTVLRRHVGYRHRGVSGQAERRPPAGRRLLRRQLQLPEQDVPREDARRLLRNDRARAIRRCPRLCGRLRCHGRTRPVSRSGRRRRVARRGARSADGARGAARERPLAARSAARRGTARRQRDDRRGDVAIEPGRSAARARAAKTPRSRAHRHRVVSRSMARGAWLLQPQHGRIARLLFPVRLVREADLGQSLPAASGRRRRGRNAAPQTRVRPRPCLVCRRHLRLPRGLGHPLRGSCSQPAAVGCLSRSSFARTW